MLQFRARRALRPLLLQPAGGEGPLPGDDLPLARRLWRGEGLLPDEGLGLLPPDGVGLGTSRGRVEWGVGDHSHSGNNSS